LRGGSERANPNLAPVREFGLALAMPLENRAPPTGDIVASPAHGLFMGNRGVLHDDDQRLGRARWRHPHWIICRLAYRGRRRRLMAPNAYTELFFLDEATALAAGHRPCALCRRDAYLAFQDAARSGLRRRRRLDASGLDRLLHEARIVKGTRRRRRFEARLNDLPDGAMIRLEGRPDDIWLIRRDRLSPWRAEGYGPPIRKPAGGRVETLTPHPTVLALLEGHRPLIHPSAA
jgi:hypothetical protein